MLQPLDEAIDKAAAVGAELVSGNDRADYLCEIARLQARLDAARLDVIGRFDADRDWAADVARSAAGWIAHKTQMPRSAAGNDVTLARRLRSMPLTTEALGNGEISAAHARLLGKAAAARGTADAFARDEELLVGFARHMSFEAFARALRFWEQHADPDGSDDRRRPGTLRVSETLDGHQLDGFLPGVSGAEVAEAVRRVAREMFESDWAAARAQFEADGRDPDLVTPHDLARTNEQRNADALVEICRRAFAAPADGTKPRPLVTILLGEDSATRVCEILGGGAVDHDDAAVALSSGDLQTIVLGQPTEPIRASQSRFFVGLLRRAIQVRDRTCRFPGCHTPATRCEVDHIDPHAEGGCTSTDNGWCLCPHHHRAKSNGRYHAIRGPDGTIRFFRPDGTEIT